MSIPIQAVKKNCMGSKQVIIAVIFVEMKGLLCSQNFHLLPIRPSEMWGPTPPPFPKGIHSTLTTIDILYRIPTSEKLSYDDLPKGKRKCLIVMHTMEVI